MLKAIMFDLDDTLLWDKKSVATAFSETCKYAASKHNINPEELEKSVRSEASELYASYDVYEFTKMIGINPFEGLWGTFDDAGESFQKMKEVVPDYRRNAWIRGLNLIGVDDENLAIELAEMFPIERKKHPFIYEETLSVLEQLKGKYQLLLLTNGSPSLQNLKLEITPEIAPYFSHIIISGAFGKGKPDQSIFEHALEECGLKADEVIMVGDNLMTDILGSSRVGMKSVWINRENNKQLAEIKPTYEVKDLKELLTIIEKY